MPVKNAPSEVSKPEFIEPVVHEDPPVETVPTPKSEDVSRDSVAPTEATKPDQAKYEAPEEVKPQSYVWLANGTVKRCNDEDLPAAGTGTFGHWNEGDAVHTIVAIYPVEEIVSGK